jgi:hypothetical protein
VQFADGQKATSLERRWDYFDPQDAAQAPPPGPVLVPQGGAGGERVRSQSYWVWPLPPDGPLAFVVEWPALGVPLTQARVDAALIRQAAAQDEGLWPAVRIVTGGWLPRPMTRPMFCLAQACSSVPEVEIGCRYRVMRPRSDRRSWPT